MLKFICIFAKKNNLVYYGKLSSYLCIYCFFFGVSFHVFLRAWQHEQ